MEKWQAKPTAVGKPNEITIVWDSTALPRALRDSIIRYWEQPYIITPQVEPLFDLRWFHPDQLEADVYKRTLRTYFIPLSTDDTSSSLHKWVARSIDNRLLLPAQKVQLRQYRDLWAKGQVIIVLRAPIGGLCQTASPNPITHRPTRCRCDQGQSLRGGPRPRLAGSGGFDVWLTLGCASRL